MKENVWKRAKALVEDQSVMVPAPGDDSALMVMSSSGNKSTMFISQKLHGG